MHGIAPVTEDLTFHHVGVACTDIAAEVHRLQCLGYAREGGEFVDPIQGVRGIFLGGQQPRLEILEPLDGRSGVLSSWLRAGTKLYHLAYEVDRLERAIAFMRQSRAKLLVPPTPAVAFQGRHIAFLILPNQLLVEFIART